MHSTQWPCLSHNDAAVFRKHLLLPNRLKIRQVSRPHTSLNKKSCHWHWCCEWVQPCPAQEPLTAASRQQWVQQAQALHKQAQLVQPRLRATKDVKSDLCDEADLEVAIAADESSGSVPERKPMQAMAMPRKIKQASTGKATSAAQGTTSRVVPKQQQTTSNGSHGSTYAGLGGYAKRVATAGVHCLVANICLCIAARNIGWTQTLFKQDQAALHQTQTCMLAYAAVRWHVQPQTQYIVL